jgi:peptidoglycan/xylan/chitin deacetylase (PgdA/CDA1 family)
MSCQILKDQISMISLMYHDIYGTSGPGETGFAGAGANSYKLSTDDFSDHLRALKDGGSEAVSILSQATSLCNGSFLLTFDDGGVSAISEIAPLLDLFGWPGHFFVTTSLIGTPGFLNLEDIKQLYRGGHIIGSHSHTHPEIMSGLTDEELTEEWQRSRDILSEIIGCNITIASVPGGFFSRRVARAASAAGIQHLFTSDPGVRVRSTSGCQLLPRYTLKQGMEADIAVGLVYNQGNWRRRQYLAWNSRKIAKKISGPLYLKIWEWLHQRDEQTV